MEDLNRRLLVSEDKNEEKRSPFTPEEIDCILCLLKDTMYYRDKKHKMGDKYLKLYNLYYSFSGKILTGIISIFYLGLIFFDPSLYSDTKISSWLLIVIELICILYYSLLTASIYIMYGKDIFWKGIWNKACVFFLLWEFLDLLGYYIFSIPRFSTAFRPFLVISRFRNIRHLLTSFFKSIRNSLNTLLFLFLFIIIWGFLGHILFTDWSNPPAFPGPICSTFIHTDCDDYFSNPFEAVWHIYTLLSTVNFPDIMLPYISSNSPLFPRRHGILITSLYFIIFIWVAIYYRKLERNNDNYLEAYSILSKYNKGIYILKSDWIYIFRLLRKDCDDEILELFYQASINVTTIKENNQEQKRLKSIRLGFNSLLRNIKLYSFYDTYIYQPCHLYYNSQLAHINSFVSIPLCDILYFILILLSCIHSIGIFFFLDKDYKQEYKIRITIYTCLFILSLLFYFIVEPSISFNIYDMSQRGTWIHNIYSLVEPYIDVITVIGTLFFRCMAILLAVFYVFIIFGSIFFKDKLVSSNENVASSAYGQNNYYALNFDTPINAFTTLFYLLVVNNWPIICEGCVAATNYFARIFFVSFHLIVVIIFMNGVSAFIVSTTFVLYKYKEQKENGDHALWEEKIHDPTYCIGSSYTNYFLHTDFGLIDTNQCEIPILHQLDESGKPSIDYESLIQSPETLLYNYYNLSSNIFDYWFEDHAEVNLVSKTYIESSCDGLLCIDEPKLIALDDVYPSFPKSMAELSIGHRAWFTLSYLNLFVYDHSSDLTIYTNADIFIYIDHTLFFYTPMTIQPRFYKLDLNELNLVDGNTYYIHLFIASRDLIPRVLTIYSTLKAIDISTELINFINPSSLSISFGVTVSGNTITFPTDAYNINSILYLTQIDIRSSLYCSFTIKDSSKHPTFIFGLYDQGPAFIHMTTDIYNTYPSSKSFLFEFFPEDQSVFMNLLYRGDNGLIKMGTIFDKSCTGDLYITFIYFYTVHMFGIYCNYKVIYTDNNIDILKYFNDNLLSLSTYVPPSYLQTSLSISNFNVYSPNICYNNTYLIKENTQVTAGINSFLVKIMLMNQNNKPFYALDSLIYQLRVVSLRHGGLESLLYITEEWIDEGQIWLYFHASIAGSYSCNIYINDHEIRWEDNNIIEVVPDTPNSHFSRISISSSLYQQPKVGVPYTVDVYLADMFNNCHSFLQSSMKLLLNSFTQGDYYQYILPKGTMAYSTNKTDNTYALNNTTTNNDSNNGNNYFFRFEFEFYETGNYSLGVFIDNIYLTDQSSFIVESGALSMENTIIWGSLLDDSIIGTEEYVLIQPKDRYNNFINGLTFTLEVRVYDTSNHTNANGYVQYSFPCVVKFNIQYQCTAFFYQSGYITATVYNEEAIYSLNNYVYTPLEIGSFDSYIKASNPVCHTITADDTYTPTSTSPSPFLLLFQYHDEYNNEPIGEPHGDEIATVLNDNTLMNCHSTSVMGQYACPINITQTGFHTLSILCKGTTVYKRSYVLGCNDKNVTISSSYIYQEHNNTLSLYFKVYDEFQNMCTYRLRYIYGLLLETRIGQAYAVAPLFDPFTASFVYSIQPKISGEYRLTIYNSGEVIHQKSFTISLLPEFEQEDSSNLDTYFIYGEGTAGGYIYKPLKIYVAVNTTNPENHVDLTFSDIYNKTVKDDFSSTYTRTKYESEYIKNESIYIYYFIYYYTPPTGVFLTEAYMHLSIYGDEIYNKSYYARFLVDSHCNVIQQYYYEETTSTDSILLETATHTRYIHYKDSHNYFIDLQEEEILNMIQNNSASYIYITRTQRCSNINDFHVLISPSYPDYSITYKGNGVYTLFLSNLIEPIYYLTAYIYGDENKITCKIISKLPQLDRHTFTYLDDYEQYNYPLEQELEIGFTIQHLYTRNYATDISFIQSNVNISVFQSDMNSSMPSTIVVTSIEGFSAYLSLHTYPLQSSPITTVISAFKECSEDSENCAPFIITPTGEMLAYVYTRDNFDNFIDHDFSINNYTILRMYNNKVELLLPGGYNVVRIGYGIFKIQLPPILPSITSSSTYYIYKYLDSENYHGENVTSEEFFEYYNEYISTSFEYIQNSLLSSSYLYIITFVRRILSQSLPAFVFCENYSVSNLHAASSLRGIVGEVVFTKFIYQDPHVVSCINLRSTIHATITSLNGYQRSPNVVSSYSDNLYYVCDFLPEDVGNYTISLYDVDNPAEIVTFDIVISLSPPSPANSYFYSDTSTTVMTKRYYRYYFTIVDSLNLNYDIRDITPSVVALLYTSLYGYDYIEIISTYYYNETHSYFDILTIVPSIYKLFITIPDTSGSSIFLYSHITITAISSTEKCPPALAPLNTTMCGMDNSCVIEGSACPYACPAETPLKCYYEDPVYHVSTYTCLPETQFCKCEYAGLIDCYSFIPTNKRQVALCAESVDQCVYRDHCPSSEPILCWDYRCATSIDLCPTIISCPPSYMKCPDNIHCVLSYQDCMP
ncbi:hypothetical protein WA158_005315 [Blastocystis sp. Blastoise]